MTIDKAIEVLKDYKMESAFETTPDFTSALQLGIEALKFVKQYEADNLVSHNPVLPGEVIITGLEEV